MTDELFESPKVIDSFTGKYRFLSNFHENPCRYLKVTWPTAEHAYQAAKCLNSEDRASFLKCKSAGAAKALGKKVKIRKDWESVKLCIMAEVLQSKFLDSQLREQLLATGDAILIEGNTWGDLVWGQCKGTGLNLLGQLLMKLRKEIKDPKPHYSTRDL